MRDLRAHDVEMLTIGQYLAPSGHHLPVLRYVHPDIFAMYALAAEGLFDESRKRRGLCPDSPRGRREPAPAHYHRTGGSTVHCTGNGRH